MIESRSKVARLPPDLRREVERRIVERAFSGYRHLASWLQVEGYDIAEQSLQRYGSRLRQEIEAKSMAASLTETIAASLSSDPNVGDSADDCIIGQLVIALAE